MLDQLPHVTGQDFLVMETPFGFLEVEAMVFGSANDGSYGDFLAILFFQAIFNKAVVVEF